MGRCSGCGADMPDYYTKCPNCGSAIVPGGGSPAPSSGGYVPPAYHQEVTTAGGWFGWMMLCGMLPSIGAIIMLNVTKDQSAKNFAKMYLIVQIIGIVLYVVFLALVLIPMMKATGGDLSALTGMQ